MATKLSNILDEQLSNLSAADAVESFLEEGVLPEGMLQSLQRALRVKLNALGVDFDSIPAVYNVDVPGKPLASWSDRALELWWDAQRKRWMWSINRSTSVLSTQADLTRDNKAVNNLVRILKSLDPKKLADIENIIRNR